MDLKVITTDLAIPLEVNKVRATVLWVILVTVLVRVTDLQAVLVDGTDRMIVMDLQLVNSSGLVINMHS